MTDRCRLLVPDGSLRQVVSDLLEEAGIPICFSTERSYRGLIGNDRLFSSPDNFALRLRPWDVPWIVADRRAELAFTADDLITEVGVVEQVIILRHFALTRGGCGETELVVAVPPGSEIKEITELTAEHELVTEYPRLATEWLTKQGIICRIRNCHGSLEAFSEIADAILENTETGRSLAEGGWRIIASVMKSQTCLITYPDALGCTKTKSVIDQVCLLLDSVIAGRPRRLLLCNAADQITLNMVLAVLPAADKPTISALANGGGFAVQTVVMANQLELLFCRLKEVGATAIFDLDMGHFVP